MPRPENPPRHRALEIRQQQPVQRNAARPIPRVAHRHLRPRQRPWHHPRHDPRQAQQCSQNVNVRQLAAYSPGTCKTRTSRHLARPQPKNRPAAYRFLASLLHASSAVSVGRHSRRTQAAAARPVSVSATLTLALRSSPWRLRSALAARRLPPADRGDGADIGHASIRRYGTRRSASAVLREPPRLEILCPAGSAAVRGPWRWLVVIARPSASPGGFRVVTCRRPSMPGDANRCPAGPGRRWPRQLLAGTQKQVGACCDCCRGGRLFRRRAVWSWAAVADGPPDLALMVRNCLRCAGCSLSVMLVTDHVVAGGMLAAVPAGGPRCAAAEPVRQCQSVHSASVGTCRAARRAGSSPATAPMSSAAPNPPAQASGGTTMAQPLVEA